MKEREATNGEKLHALIVSFQMRETFQTALKHMKKKDSAATQSWGDVALILQHSMVNSTSVNIKHKVKELIQIGD